MADCPGVYKLAKMKDGFLARIRVPGSMLDDQNLTNIAKAAISYGNGEIDLTNRANFQIRGIEPENQKPLVDFLLANNLITKNPDHDRLRNISIDPLSGLMEEKINCRPYAHALDQALLKSLKSKKALTHLSPKFSVVFEGGGSSNIASLSHDIGLIAYKDKFKLYLASKPTGFMVSQSKVVNVVIQLMEHLHELNSADNSRIKTVVQELGWEKLLDEVHKACPDLEKATSPASQDHDREEHINPSPNLIKLKGKNTFALTIMAPSGRLHSHQLLALAEIIAKWGDGTIRITPWQSFVITDVLEKDISKVWHASEASGMLTQQVEQNLRIISCAGSEGCIHGKFETIAKSLELRETFNEKAFPKPITIHLSACEKGCASRKKTDYLYTQRETDESPCLFLNAAPNTTKKGKTVLPEDLSQELIKLV